MTRPRQALSRFWELDGFEVSWAILERDSALSRALLDLPAWRLIYRDDIAEVS